MFLFSGTGVRKHLLNHRLIVHFIGLTLLFEAGFMVLNILACWIFDRASIMPVLESCVITALLGGGLYVYTYSKVDVEPGIRDSFVVVAVSWVILGMFGTLPFLLSHSITNFTDAWFESFSGFTTTGSSILMDIEAMPKGILFWRSETHWIGGMGIIVLMLAVFPHFKVNGMQLFGAESSAFVFERLKPRLIDNVKRLWFIYLFLTVLETMILKMGGMDWFDSICHAFGTIATGGFSTKNQSVAAFSPFIQYVIGGFMLLSGINFALHYYLLHGKTNKVWKNEEFRLYLRIVLVAVVIVSILLVHDFNYSLEKTFRETFFQVISVITCTGFSTSDYTTYASPAVFILFLLMLIGGCAGSTSGGIKVVRILILFKHLRLGVQKLVHPAMIKPVKYNNTVVEENLQNSLLSYIVLYLILVGAGTFIMLLFGLDIRTAAGSVATCLGGVGPGLGRVGPNGNFFALPTIAKYILTLFMLLGRLEILTVLVIFTPSFRNL